MMLHRITGLNHGLVGDFKIHSQRPTHSQAHMPRLTLSISQHQTPKPTALTPSSDRQPSIPHHHSIHSTAQVGAYLVSLIPLSASISDPRPRRKQLHPLSSRSVLNYVRQPAVQKCDQVERTRLGVGVGVGTWPWCCMRFSDGARPSLRRVR